MGVWRQIGEYLWIVKKDPDAPKSFYLSNMHFINRLSILVFILGMIILVVKMMKN